jgi:hypothetical protein
MKITSGNLFLEIGLTAKTLPRNIQFVRLKVMEESKPTESTEEATKSNNPENAVSEQLNEIENAIYPDWTPFQNFP